VSMRLSPPYPNPIPLRLACMAFWLPFCGSLCVPCGGTSGTFVSESQVLGRASLASCGTGWRGPCQGNPCSLRCVPCTCTAVCVPSLLFHNIHTPRAQAQVLPSLPLLGSRLGRGRYLRTTSGRALTWRVLHGCGSHFDRDYVCVFVLHCPLHSYADISLGLQRLCP
jgi:hypothetical protein